MVGNMNFNAVEPGYQRRYEFIADSQIKNRASFILPARIKCCEKYRELELLKAIYITLGFAHTPAIFLRRFFIISVSLHVPY